MRPHGKLRIYIVSAPQKHNANISEFRVLGFVRRAWDIHTMQQILNDQAVGGPSSKTVDQLKIALRICADFPIFSRIFAYFSQVSPDFRTLSQILEILADCHGFWDIFADVQRFSWTFIDIRWILSMSQMA